MRGFASPALAAALACILLLSGCDEATSPASAAPEMPPPPVDVAKPLVKDVVEWDEYTGRFEPTERVELRARVSGYLEQVHFRDGQIVRKGDLLFTVDSRPFAAEVARARAEVQRAEAAVQFADKELERAQQLLRTRNISQDRVDDRQANKIAADAAVAAANAVLQSATLQLSFTRIVAPVTGRISDRKIDVGNLISGGDAQAPALATIVSLDPIYFVFDASESDYLRYQRLDSRGYRPSSRDTDNPVYVRLVDEDDWSRQGRMNFVDNAFNAGSGTIRGRAVFDNPDMLLTPGMFGRLRLVGSNSYRTLLLPDAAVLSDQSARIVMVADAEGTVQVRRVEIGPVIEGLRVIRSGIEAEDQVIVGGVQRARPGGKVTPNQTTIAQPGNTTHPG